MKKPTKPIEDVRSTPATKPERREVGDRKLDRMVRVINTGQARPAFLSHGGDQCKSTLFDVYTDKRCELEGGHEHAYHKHGSVEWDDYVNNTQLELRHWLRKGTP